MKNNFVGIALFAYLALAAGLSLNVRAGGELYTYMGENTLTYGYQALEQTSSAISTIASTAVVGVANAAADVYSAGGYQPIEPTVPPPPTLYGDVDGGGAVNVTDVVRIQNYISGNISLSPAALVRADVNEDGVVNVVDVVLTRNIAVGNLSQSSADRKFIFGDLTGDGGVNVQDAVKLQNIIAGTYSPTNRERIAADVDMSGSITPADVDLVMNTAVGKITKLPVMYGDLNRDYRVTTVDYVMLSRAVDRTVSLSVEQGVLANVNRDTLGNINTKDVETLRKYVIGSIKYIPINLGDLNNDGKINISDVVLLNRIIQGIQTPTEEQKLAGDLNADGKLTADDLSILRQFIVGLITNLPIGQTSAPVRVDVPVQVVPTTPSSQPPVTPAPITPTTNVIAGVKTVALNATNYMPITGVTFKLYNSDNVLVRTAENVVNYTFYDLSAGYYTIKATAIGYTEATTGVVVRAGIKEDITLNVIMTRNAP